MNNGFISLHRKIKDNWIWKKPEYFQWFIYLLFRANFKDTKVLIGSDLHDVKRGQFITSIQKLTLKLNNCTTQKIRTFLKLLQKDKIINIETTSKLTIITICKYDSYQTQQQTSNKPATSQQQTNNKPATTENKDNNNEIKTNNVNKDKGIEIPTTPEKINYDDVKKYFNVICQNLPKVKILTDARKKAIKNIIKKFGKEKLKEVFEITSKSDFLNGNNKQNWIANFDWIIKPANFVKILENNYKNGAKKHISGAITEDSICRNPENHPNRLDWGI